MDVHLTAELHHRVINEEDGSESWAYKRKLIDKAVPIHQAPNVFNSEVQHFKIAYVTDEEAEEKPSNKIIAMFGQFFVAMDFH